MPPKNLVYFGSPEFSARILEAVLAFPEIRVVGVVTQPDKPKGRKQVFTPSPVALKAASFDLPVFKPATLDNANLSHISLLKPDIFLVVSYGKIIPESWLNTPTIGTFNIHFSLLPRYRGALCIHEAIKNRDKETGVTLMLMDDKLDHGPIISQSKIAISDDDDVASLTTKLTHSAIDLLAQKIPEICARKFTPITQDESQATYTAKTSSLTRKEAFIPFSQIEAALLGREVEDTSARVRSLSPEPGPWTEIAGLEVKIIKTHTESGKLVIDLVQLPGKTPVPWKQFSAGYLK